MDEEPYLKSIEPTSQKRRAEIEVLRTKAGAALDKLNEALDEDRHDDDCVLRCFDYDTNHVHGCWQCRKDGEA